VSLHDKKGIGKKDKKRWHCDKILVHLKKIAPWCDKVMPTWLMKNWKVCEKYSLWGFVVQGPYYPHIS
jgi:hypothetical protein